MAHSIINLLNILGGIDQFIKQQEYDMLKKEYARKHDIDLYVIDCSSGNINLLIKSLKKIFI